MLDIDLLNDDIQIYLDKRGKNPKLKFIDVHKNKDIDDYLVSFDLDLELESLIVIANMFIDAYEYLTHKKELETPENINYN